MSWVASRVNMSIDQSSKSTIRWRDQPIATVRRTLSSTHIEEKDDTNYPDNEDSSPSNDINYLINSSIQNCKLIII